MLHLTRSQRLPSGVAVLAVGGKLVEGSANLLPVDVVVFTAVKGGSRAESAPGAMGQPGSNNEYWVALIGRAKR